MRLIDIDRISEADKEAHGFKKDYDLNHLLESQPIVSAGCWRCKDCKYLQLEDMGMYATCGRSYLGMVRPSDYCSKAERKADTADDTTPSFMSEWAREIDEQLDNLKIKKENKQ